MHSLVGQLGRLQLQAHQLQACVQHVQSNCSTRPSALARFQSRDINELVEMALEPPQITLPRVSESPSPQQQQQQQQQKQQHRAQRPRPLSAPAGPAARTTQQSNSTTAYQTQHVNHHPHHDYQHQQPQASQHVLSAPLPKKKMEPSLMDFAVMLAELQSWRQRHSTAHVPRFCFDAPELGAWVRFLRKQHKEGLLEQWKVDSLNLVAFEWELSDQEAKWHHLYHQLRRYRALYGSTDIDVTHSAADGCDWHRVEGWLRRQAKLLARQKLSSQQRAMLQQLGVRLTVPKQLVQRTALLQATNGTERRQLRKKWKLQDNMAHEARRTQQQLELQQLLEQRRQQRQVEQRRRRLLQRAAAAAAAVSSQADVPGQQMQQELVSIVVQQVHSVQQLSNQRIPQQQQQQQLHHEGPGSVAALQAGRPHQAIFQLPQQNTLQQHPLQLSLEQELPGAVAAAAMLPFDGPLGDPQQPDEAADFQLSARVQRFQPMQQPQQQQDAAADLVQQQQLAATVAGVGQQQQQQQQQPPQVLLREAGALLFRPNRRSKKVRNTSRQERWLTPPDS